MSIQTTIHISRDEVIDRILLVDEIIRSKNYQKLHSITFESYNLANVVDNYDPIDLSNIHNWANTMLEDLIDQPFFRMSLFNNYIIT